MEFLPADYVLGGLAVVMAVLGLFRGFSGTLAFFVGSAAAAAVGSFGWPLSANYTEVVWIRWVAVLVAVLLAFGLSRLIVKKLVNGLLAQPTDALFGALVGLAFAVGVVVVWAMSGLGLEYSNVATQAAALLRQ